MHVHDWPHSATASAGAVSGNTVTFAHGMLNQIVVIPSKATTEYGFRLTDLNNVVVFEEQARGSMRREVNIPRVGILTWAIFSSSKATESFTILLKGREE